MEAFGVAGFNSTGAVTKKRSNIPRRPRPESQPVFASREISSILASDKVDKNSSDENTGHYSGFHRKELNVNNSLLFNRNEGETHPRKSRKDDSTFGDLGGFYGTGTSRGNSLDHRRSSEGVLAPANWKTSNKVNFDSQSRNSDIVSGRTVDSRNPGISPNGSGGRADASSHENKLRKVKLKVGGVTRTIHAKSTLDNSLSGGSSKPSRTSDTPRPRQKLILQENSDDEPSPPNRTNGVQGIPMKDFGPSRHTDRSSEPVRKSKRVPKRRVLDGAFDEEEDEELRYLGRLKTAKVSADYRTEYGDDGEDDSKRRKCLKLSKSRSGDGEHDDGGEDYGSSRRSKDGKKKFRSERESEDTDYAEDEDNYPGSDGGPESKRKRPRKESLDSLGDGKKEVSLTTRQRALLSGKCAPSGSADNLIEFPNGLPPAPPRKQKEKLSEVEQQLKKAEAAQRRRMQVEKANKESQEEAIRKILGQDSNRKKKEDKQRKQRDELAREKAATAATLASSTVRWVMGPTGTVVMFPPEFGLPSIFDSKTCSYPPPREKCAGPSCTNTYKYRDSKSKLPLCSLQCYRAIQGTTQPVTTC